MHRPRVLSTSWDKRLFSDSLARRRRQRELEEIHYHTVLLEELAALQHFGKLSDALVVPSPMPLLAHSISPKNSAMIAVPPVTAHHFPSLVGRRSMPPPPKPKSRGPIKPHMRSIAGEWGGRDADGILSTGEPEFGYCEPLPPISDLKKKIRKYAAYTTFLDKIE
jgi:hypothetical protein